MTDDVGQEPSERTKSLMPFHAAFLGLTVPPVAAALVLFLLGASPTGLPLLTSSLAPAYLIGGVPAFLAGNLDVALARSGWGAAARLAVAAGLGSLAGMFVLAPLYLAGMVGGFLPLLLPLACAAAAVVGLGFSILLARLIN